MTTYTLDIRTDTAHFPGIGRYVRNLALQMAPLLHEDETLVLLSNSDNPPLLSELKSVSRRVKACRVSASPFSIRQQRQIPTKLRAIARDNHDVPVYHSSYVLMPYRTPCPTILTIYDLIALKYPHSVSLQARITLPLANWLALRASQRVIAISDATCNDLLSHYRVDSDKVVTIPLAADDRYWPRNESEQWEVRATYKLEGPFFLYVGINKPHKNLTRLIAAYARLHGLVDDPTELPKLVIAGAWDERYNSIKAIANHHSLDESLRFLGRIEEEKLPALYSAATAFVYPSLYEGFGLPILEAMACGAPVACAHNSSLPEVAGDAAYYFDAEDTELITMALHALASSAGLRNSLSENGRRQVQRFSWTRTASQTLELYRALLAES